MKCCSIFLVFFRPSESQALPFVCKKWHDLVADPYFAKQQYSQFKITAQQDNQSGEFCVKEALRLEKARAQFMSELEALPYWFDDITRKDSEKILLSGNYEAGAFLLRKSSQKACIALSVLFEPDENKKLFTPVAKKEGVIIPTNKHKYVLPNTNIDKSESDKLVVYNILFSVFESKHKKINIREELEPNLKGKIYSSVKEFDNALRTDYGNPLDRENLPDISEEHRDKKAKLTR